MMFLRNLRWLILVFFVTIAAVRADPTDLVPPDTLPDTLPSTVHKPSDFVSFVFDAERLKKAFGEKIDFYTNVFMAMAFLMLVLPSMFGLVQRGLSAEALNKFVIKPLILCAFIAIVPDMKIAMSDGFNELASAAGYSGVDLVTKYYTETSIFDLGTTVHDLKESESSDDTIFKRLTEMVSYFRNALHWVIQQVIAIPFAVLLSILGIVTRIGVYIGDFVRTFLMEVGYALLPFFIAGFNFSGMHHASTNYVKRIVCLHFWPLGWSLVGAVTVTIVHLLHLYVADIFQTATSHPLESAGLAGVVTLMGAWQYVTLGALLVIVLVMIIATFWQLFGLYKAPKIMTDLILHGSLAFEGAWGQVLQQSAKTFAAVATAAVAPMAAPVAAAGAAGATTAGAAATAGGASSMGVAGAKMMGGFNGAAGAMGKIGMGQVAKAGGKMMAQAVSGALREGIRRAGSE